MRHSSLRGRDLHSPSNELVENTTMSPISKYRAVTYSGMGAVYPAIAIASGATDLVRGITQDDIAVGDSGYITCLGFLPGVNTSTWPVGTKLYANSVGVLTVNPSGLPIATVLKQSSTAGVLYVDNTGVTKGDLSELQFPDPLSLELEWSILYPSFYTEPSYSGGLITRVDIYDTSAKVVHVFSKTFTYTMGKLSRVLLTREYDGQTLQKDITYDGSGNVMNVTRSYTP